MPWVPSCQSSTLLHGVKAVRRVVLLERDDSSERLTGENRTSSKALQGTQIRQRNHAAPWVAYDAREYDRSPLDSSFGSNVPIQPLKDLCPRALTVSHVINNGYCSSLFMGLLRVNEKNEDFE